MNAHKVEENSMYEKEYESRITRLETLQEKIAESLIEIKENQKEMSKELSNDIKSLRVDLTNDIKNLRTETWTQTKWVIGFIFIILGSPYFMALINKIPDWMARS